MKSGGIRVTKKMHKEHWLKCSKLHIHTHTHTHTEKYKEVAANHCSVA